MADEDDAITISVPVHLEFYLRHRIDPFVVRALFPVLKDTFEGLDAAEDLEQFAECCIQSVLAVIDIRGEERFVFTDERQNKFIVKTEEIQSISVLAPDANTIQDLLLTSE